jgi:putative oxidoreductase
MATDYNEESPMDFGLLILRLAVGFALAAHGAQKWFGWFGGYGIAGTGGYFEQLGFHPGKRAALLAGMAETLGGLALALGAATPLAAAILIGVMLVAIVAVHLEKGFFVMNGGYEYPLLIAVAALSLSFMGPGRFSVDALAGREYAGLSWGTASLLLGVIAASLQLVFRRAPAAQTKPKTA